MKRTLLRPSKFTAPDPAEIAAEQREQKVALLRLGHELGCAADGLLAWAQAVEGWLEPRRCVQCGGPIPDERSAAATTCGEECFRARMRLLASARWIGRKSEGRAPAADADRAAIDKFIAERGVTRVPPAHLAPSQHATVEGDAAKQKLKDLRLADTVRRPRAAALGTKRRTAARASA